MIPQRVIQLVLSIYNIPSTDWLKLKSKSAGTNVAIAINAYPFIGHFTYVYCSVVYLDIHNA